MSPFELMQKHLSRPTSTRELGYLFLFVLAIFAIWTGLYVWERQRRLPASSRPDRRPLFERLVAVHQLTEAQSDCLAELAQRQSLADPLTLFVDPRILESAMLTEPQRAAQWSELGRILFGSEFSSSAGQS